MFAVLITGLIGFILGAAAFSFVLLFKGRFSIISFMSCLISVVLIGIGLILSLAATNIQEDLHLARNTGHSIEEDVQIIESVVGEVETESVEHEYGENETVTTDPEGPAKQEPEDRPAEKPEEKEPDGSEADSSEPGQYDEMPFDRDKVMDKVDSFLKEYEQEGPVIEKRWGEAVRNHDLRE